MRPASDEFSNVPEGTCALFGQGRCLRAVRDPGPNSDSAQPGNPSRWSATNGMPCRMATSCYG